MTSMNLFLVRQRIERELADIAPYFVPGMRLTFIARHPDNPEADLVITSDSLDGIAAVVERRKAAGGK